MPATAVCQAPDPAGTLQQATPLPPPLSVCSDASSRPPSVSAASPLANTALGLLQHVCQTACSWSATSCLVSRHKLLCSGPGVWATGLTGKNKWNNNAHHSPTHGCGQIKETVGQVDLWVFCEELDEAKPRRFSPQLWRFSRKLEIKLFSDRLPVLGKAFLGLAGCGLVVGRSTSPHFKVSHSPCQRQLPNINLLNHFLCLVPDLVLINDVCCFRLNSSLLMTTLVQSLSQSSEWEERMKRPLARHPLLATSYRRPEAVLENMTSLAAGGHHNALVPNK